MEKYPQEKFLYTVQPDDTLLSLVQKFHTTVYAVEVMNPGVDLNQLQAGQVIYMCPGYIEYSPDCHPVHGGISRRELELSNHLRMLWEQHIA